MGKIARLPVRTRRHGPRSRYDEATQRRAVQRWASGESAKTIARELGCDQSIIYSWAKVLGAKKSEPKGKRRKSAPAAGARGTPEVEWTQADAKAFRVIAEALRPLDPATRARIAQIALWACDVLSGPA